MGELEVVKAALLKEINTTNKCFINQENDLEELDNYNKYILMSFYRAIENLIEILFDNRIKMSDAKYLYQVIYEKITSNYIDPSLLKHILLEKLNNRLITYNDIWNYINDNNLMCINIEIKKEDVKKQKYKMEDNFTIEEFIELYKNCKTNRNKIMHNIIKKDENLSNRIVIESLVVYAYISIVID